MTVSIPMKKVGKAMNIHITAQNYPIHNIGYFLVVYLMWLHASDLHQLSYNDFAKRERFLHRWQTVKISEDMRSDLAWWPRILSTSSLNGVPMAYFNAAPPPDIIVEVDASNSGCCAFVRQEHKTLVYEFTSSERNLILQLKVNPNTGFDIKVRELLPRALAIHQWGRQSAIQPYKFYSFEYNLRISASHIPGELRTIAGAGYRRSTDPISLTDLLT
ncbi:hypothetical protein PHMEG_00023305 [Phytophthora megakarya]|uniref:Uncharacterized protein n=1 Tax=Phytophthora megakarya TaxID=4795 RepID=A0A225VH63_9STRA|nr:hypothetical protein PHMEG_00023305 [Phytophthora megakarya]